MGKVYRFKFLVEIGLHWLFHVGFAEIRFLKRHDVDDQFKFLVFGNIECFQVCPYFFLKTKWDFKKINI